MNFLAKKYKNLKSTEWNEDVRRSNLCTKKKIDRKESTMLSLKQDEDC